MQLSINQGADFFARFQVTNQAGTVVDLTGYIGKSEIRDSAGGALIGTFTVTLGGLNGFIDMVMDDLITNALTPGSYVYDVFISNAATGDIQNVIGGSVSVSARITL